MNITEARIDHLSDLARLSLPGGEKEELSLIHISEPTRH